MSSSDFEIIQGSTFLLTMQWLSNGTPVDLTGYSAKLKIINNPAPTNQSFYLVFASDGTGDANTSMTLGTDGTINLRAEASVTAALTFTKAPYVLLMRHPDAVTVDTLTKGNVKLTSGVTY